MDTTPSIALPSDAPSGIPRTPPASYTIRGRELRWGSRTFVMGILNVTPDSFSGDGLLAPERAAGAPTDPVAAAVAQALRMAEQGADLLDIGGESSRPGHPAVDETEELRRVVPVVRAVRDALPDMPISIDTVKPRVATAALDAGADLINDVEGVREDDGILRLVAERQVPYVLMHTRAEARYGNVLAELLADLQRAVDRAIDRGVAPDLLILDPGIGFGKTAEHNLHVLRHVDTLHLLGRPLLVGTSRKSTVGKVLDLPASERLEGTLALTALAVASSVDIVRVHDVGPNVRAARMADAVHRAGRIGERGWEPEDVAG